MNYELTSAYKPTGDQPEAIAQLTEGVLQGVPAQTLLGVTEEQNAQDRFAASSIGISGEEGLPTTSSGARCWSTDPPAEQKRKNVMEMTDISPKICQAISR